MSFPRGCREESLILSFVSFKAKPDRCAEESRISLKPNQSRQDGVYTVDCNAFSSPTASELKQSALSNPRPEGREPALRTNGTNGSAPFVGAG